MAQAKLPPAYGKIVSGDEFWNRKAELEEFTDLIVQRANILLIAQRRMGKSSLMKHTALELTDRFNCISLDLENADKPEDVIVDLGKETSKYKSLWSKTLKLITFALEAVEEINVEGVGLKLRADLNAGNWDVKGDQLFDILATSDKQVVLMFDEVPIFIQRLLTGKSESVTREGIANADMFLSWLRKNLQKHQNQVSAVITGSIGLTPILHRVGLSSTINNLKPLELPPWDNQTSIECLYALAQYKGVVFEDGAPEKLMELMGVGIPHYVQKFFSEALAIARRKNPHEILVEDVVTAYTQSMLGALGQADMSNYEERLKKVLGQENLPLALEYLTEVAVNKSISINTIESIVHIPGFEHYQDPAIRREVLEILIHDGYLQFERRSYKFVSKLIQDWWKRRYGAGYISISKRVRKP